MRLRRSRLEEFFHKKMTVKKDKEGSTSEEYGAASSVTGESWPASGKVQAEQYGQRLNYIRNIRIQGSYKIQTDEKGRLHYILEDGTDIEERDGICLYVAADQLPDYRIVSIKSYQFPYHGGGKDMSVNGFDEVEKALAGRNRYETC